MENECQVSHCQQSYKCGKEEAKIHPVGLQGEASV